MLEFPSILLIVHWSALPDELLTFFFDFQHLELLFSVLYLLPFVIKLILTLVVAGKSGILVVKIEPDLAKHLENLGGLSVSLTELKNGPSTSFFNAFFLLLMLKKQLLLPFLELFAPLLLFLDFLSWVRLSFNLFLRIKVRVFLEHFLVKLVLFWVILVIFDVELLLERWLLLFWLLFLLFPVLFIRTVKAGVLAVLEAVHIKILLFVSLAGVPPLILWVVLVESFGNRYCFEDLQILRNGYGI